MFICSLVTISFFNAALNECEILFLHSALTFHITVVWNAFELDNILNCTSNIANMNLTEPWKWQPLCENALFNYFMLYVTILVKFITRNLSNLVWLQRTFFCKPVVILQTKECLAIAKKKISTKCFNSYLMVASLNAKRIKKK